MRLGAEPSAGGEGGGDRAYDDDATCVCTWLLYGLTVSADAIS